jgi:TPR repeat protein
MYEYGLGVPKDDKEAVNWFRKAGEQGDDWAQTNLGVMYEYGRGVPQDYETALNWYRKAGEQGYAWAQTNLGVMYEYGRGVPKDYVQAHKWYNIAGANGDETGRESRDIIEKRMTAGQIAQAQDMARQWFTSYANREKNSSP